MKGKNNKVSLCFLLDIQKEKLHTTQALHKKCQVTSRDFTRMTAMSWKNNKHDNGELEV